ncbi:GNAT family N-acetyltransferase [Dysgonomonas sp. 25]|uniref:GNAT family N-acetyltransferase n=1 Tax=Dysgonomonas sp. 25 TaxID=2302933 RepID=UPI0013D35705|nr:GNAT family N-acetyltransferase [Dysgonomonas sp. 25]NDV67432.1 GNAT family N-acetyltransferase [Dysgonomonas sp. 25]
MLTFDKQLIADRRFMDYALKEITVDEESLKEITAFLQESFPKNKKFTLDFVRWQYTQNPLGQMRGYNAYDNGKIISHFAGLPIDMNLFGKERKGLLCINVSTNENYRGKKLFTLLGEKTIEYAQANGYDFMIAVPNANSSHAFLKYFGFYLISPLTVKLGVGKNIYSDKAFNCYKTWDENQMHWRLQNPDNKYHFTRKFISTPISYFFKTLSKNPLPDAVAHIASSGIGFRPYNLYIGLGAETKKGWYINIPSFVKRPPFNLVFRDLTGEIPAIKKEDIFLQLIDLDTI